jgi:hypothetical protein
VSHPENILTRVNEMHAIKEGLLDLSYNYKKDIKKIQIEVEELKEIKRQQNIQQDSDETGIDKAWIQQKKMAEEADDMETKNKLELYENNLGKMSMDLYESEYRYKKLSKVINDSCTTISRVMYQ